MVASLSTRGFNCANCGAAVELRALTHTRSVACTSCAAILDPRDPNLHVLQTAALKLRYRPTIPLGSRGTWNGHPYEVVGFQRREISVEGVEYGWNEYVLFNPYRGFHYLSEYEGHWNDIRTLRELPMVPPVSGRSIAIHRTTEFRHFQHATATTTFVLGEFPWHVRVGDAVSVDDYVAPPHMLSSERTEDGVTWSLGEYVDARRIWEAFELSGQPVAPTGVFANQPSPYVGRVSRTFATCGMLLLLLAAVFVGRQALAAREPLFSGQYTYRPASDGNEPAFVTENFRVTSPSTVEIGLQADVFNNWLDFDLALVNVDTGVALNVERDVSYFSGTDSDGAWTEGARTSQVLLPSVSAGEYYLRVEPTGTNTPIGYEIRVRRDVPSWRPYPLALALLLAPPLLVWLRSASFETRRWQESDYGSAWGSGDDDSSDDGSGGDGDGGGDD